MLEAQVMSYADALRGYLSHLRKENKVSQPVLAEAMGIARNTYIAWETGETKDLKVPLMIRAMRFFHVPLEHLIETTRDPCSYRQVPLLRIVSGDSV